MFVLSGMKMISKPIFKKLRKSFNLFMWSGRDDTFRWITEKLVSVIFSCQSYH